MGCQCIDGCIQSKALVVSSRVGPGTMNISARSSTTCVNSGYEIAARISWVATTKERDRMRPSSSKADPDMMFLLSPGGMGEKKIGLRDDNR
jgi:hypothetical protein